MRRLRVTSAIAAFAVMALIVAACSSDSKTTASSASSAGGQKGKGTKIGLIYDTTAEATSRSTTPRLQVSTRESRSWVSRRRTSHRRPVVRTVRSCSVC